MTLVKLMGALPGGDNNGAAAIGADLIKEPHRMRPMIAIVDCRRVAIDSDSGERTATVRIRRIEALRPDDLGAAEKLMRRALESRTGATVLPLDLEDEIAAAFAEFDPDADDDEAAGPGDDEEGEAGEDEDDEEDEDGEEDEDEEDDL
jgi:hypothetical protein